MSRELLRIELDGNKREARILSGDFIVAKIYCVAGEGIDSHLLIDTNANPDKSLTDKAEVN